MATATMTAETSLKYSAEMFSRSASEKAEIVRVTADIKEGEVLTVETRELRGGEMQLLSFALTDYTNTIKCKAFLRYKPERGALAAPRRRRTTARRRRKKRRRLTT